jgi:hypothetical protein
MSASRFRPGRVSLKKTIDDAGTDVEIRPVKRFERTAKVQQTESGSSVQNSERASGLNAMPLSFSSPLIFIHQQKTIGTPAERYRNGFALTGVEFTLGIKVRCEQGRLFDHEPLRS